MKDNKESLIENTLICLSFFIILIAIIWPSSTKEEIQSNKIDNTKTQIQIIVKRINIRESPTISSADLGDVYEGEIYTVLEHIDQEEYFWYKISTETGITGYIASDPKHEYVKIISGNIDRIAPEIIFEEPFLIFYNDDINLEKITCKDESSTCSLSYELDSFEYIKIKGTDESGNCMEKYIKYYMVYDKKNGSENDPYLKLQFSTQQKDKYFSIETKYTLKKDILNGSKSISYQPILTFYDEDFKELIDITNWFKSLDIKECINNENMTLKDEYKNTDLKQGSILCINYLFRNDNRIKYYAFGFTGIDNYLDKDNYLANYFSKYYIYR